MVWQDLKGLMADMATKDTREKIVSNTLHHRVINDRGARVRHIDHHRTTIVSRTQKRQGYTRRTSAHIHGIRRWMRRVRETWFEGFSPCDEILEYIQEFGGLSTRIAPAAGQRLAPVCRKSKPSSAREQKFMNCDRLSALSLRRDV